MIAKLGYDIYVRSYSYLGVCVYRTVVPGMSEIYPVDDLIYNNPNSGIDFPRLAAGSTGISLGTGITKVEITPRWFVV